MSKRQEEIKAMQITMDRLDPFSTSTSQCCPACGTRMASAFSWGDEATCGNCGERTAWTDDLIHKVLPEFTPLEKVGIARALTYYHWTTMDKWEKELPKSTMAHLGCKQAAYARARDSFSDDSGKQPQNPEGFVYTVELIPGVPFEPSLRADEEDMSSKRRPYSVNNFFKEKYADTVERYVNVVEAPGSISICATKEMFTVVGKQSAREFFGEEAMNIAGANNLA